jgi:hypothetical protein
MAKVVLATSSRAKVMKVLMVILLIGVMELYILIISSFGGNVN